MKFVYLLAAVAATFSWSITSYAQRRVDTTLVETVRNGRSLVEVNTHIVGPTKADKLLFIAHGSGGSSENIKRKPEFQSIIQLANQNGILVVIPESNNRLEKKWNVSTTDLTNPDLARLQSLENTMVTLGYLKRQHSTLMLGHSQGNSITTLAGYVFQYDALSINNSPGLTKVIRQRDFDIPMIFVIDTEDKNSNASRETDKNMSYLLARGVRTEKYMTVATGHSFSSYYEKAILSFLMNLENAPSQAIFAKQHLGFHHKDDLDGISVDARGNTYVTADIVGTVTINGKARRSKGFRDIVFYKLDPKGKELWFTQFGDDDDETTFDLTLDHRGGLIANGMNGFGKQIPKVGNEDYRTLTMKLDTKTGKILWRKSFGSGGGNEVKTDSKGNIYASFMSYKGLTVNGKFHKSPGNGTNQSAYLIKMDPQGNAKWVVATQSANNERIRAVGVGYNDTRIVVGYEYWKGLKVGGVLYQLPRGTRGSRGAYIVLNPYGKILNTTILDSTGPANIRAAGGYDNGLYVSGFFNGTTNLSGRQLKSKGKNDTLLAKIDRRGDPIWIRTLGNKESEPGGELAVTDNGDLFLSGTYSGSGYSLYSQWGRKLKTLLPRTLFEKGYWVKISKNGDYLDSESINQKVGQSFGGVIEWNNNHMVIQYGIIGRAAVNQTSLISTEDTIKDASLVKYNFRSRRN